MGAGRRESVEHTHVTKVAQVAAATATREETVFVAPCPARIRRVTVVSDVAVTGDNTNSKTLNVLNKGAAGVGVASLGTLVLSTGVNLVAFDEKEVPITPTSLAAGDVVNLQFAQVGTGVIVGPLTVSVDWEPL